MEVLVPEGADRGLPWHYGDPFHEQRRMEQGCGALVLGSRGVINLVGADRLIWLNAWVAEPLADAPLDRGVRFTLIGEDGHVSAIIHGADDGESFWGMVDGDWPLVGFWLQGVAKQSGQNVAAIPWPSDQRVAAWLGNAHPVRRRVAITASLMSQVGRGRLVILPPDQAAATVADEPVGAWAYEALRIAAREPRPPQDTDAKTTPAELSGIPKPTRRLRLVHLDGSAPDPTPPIGTVLLADAKKKPKEIGRLGSTAQHYEQGPIGLALVSADVPRGTTLKAGQTPATVV